MQQTAIFRQQKCARILIWKTSVSELFDFVIEEDEI